MLMPAQQFVLIKPHLSLSHQYIRVLIDSKGKGLYTQGSWERMSKIKNHSKEENQALICWVREFSELRNKNS